MVEWHDCIPEHGVLCWVYDDKVDGYDVDVIISKINDNHGFIYKAINRTQWGNATPLTDDEIKLFLRGKR